MLSQCLLCLVPLALLANTVLAQCDGETPALLCYTSPDNTPQNVTTADVEYAAEYLRSYGAQTRAGRQFVMTVADAADCAEWSVYTHGTVLVTAKHINSTLNSSVLYSDIANTIDGGAGATTTQQSAAIIGCGTTGGALGVQYDADNVQYNSSASAYPVGYTPEGILIKVVASGA